MAIEHDFFGLLDDDGSGGVRWSETVEIGDQPVEVVVRAADAEAVTDHGLARAAAMVSMLEILDARAKDSLVAQLTHRETAASRYVDARLDASGEELGDLLDNDAGDVATEILRSLALATVELDVEAEAEDEPFALFAYAPGDDEDEWGEISVAFDDRADVTSIEWDE